MTRAAHIILQIARLEDQLERLVLSHDDRVIIMRAIEELQGELRTLVSASAGAA